MFIYLFKWEKPRVVQDDISFIYLKLYSTQNIYCLGIVDFTAAKRFCNIKGHELRNQNFLDFLTY